MQNRRLKQIKEKQLAAASNSTKALVSSYTRTNQYHTPAEIRYTFKLPNDLSLFPEAAFDESVDRNVSLTEIKKDRDLINHAIRLWESVANLKIIEDDKNPNIYIFQFKHVSVAPGNKITRGYALYPNSNPKNISVIGFNVDVLATGDFSTKLRLILHEFGHAFGLKHPFSGKHQIALNERTLYFSVMNYQKTLEERIPVSPTPYDIRAMQFIYGNNDTTNAGDTVYQLSDYNRPNTVSTIWDSYGVDTLSVKGLENTTINLREGPYQVSSFNNSYIVLAYGSAIENALVDRSVNTIVVLNEYNNVVNLRHSENTTIYIDPENTRHDVIFGFKLGQDRLIIEQAHHRPAPSWNMTGISASATIISFNANNTVTLVDVSSADLELTIMPTNISAVLNHGASGLAANIQETEIMLKEIVSSFPEELYDEFNNAFNKGTILTLLTCLSGDVLARFKIPMDTIRLFFQVAECLIIFYNSSLIASASAFCVGSLLNYLGFSRRSQLCASMATATVISVLENSTPRGIVNIAGRLVGNRCTLWAYKQAARFLPKKIEKKETNVLLPSVKVHQL
jgi:hypothetical protein